MKVLSRLFVFSMFMLTTQFVQAQDTNPEKFFIGKWKLLVEGLPNGDTEMILVIEKVNGKLAGSIGDGGSGMTKLSKVEIDKNTLNINFIGQGYNVPLYLDKKGDNEVEGSMNDMFDVTGKKVTEPSK